VAALSEFEVQLLELIVALDEGLDLLDLLLLSLLVKLNEQVRVLETPQLLQAAQVRYRTDRTHPTHILVVRGQIVYYLSNWVEFIEFTWAHDDGLIGSDGYLYSLFGKPIELHIPLLWASGHIEAYAWEAF
jgi:hypothetical protein